MPQDKIENQSTNRVERHPTFLATLAAFGIGIFFAAGVVTVETFERAFGVDGLFPRDFNTVAAFGARNVWIGSVGFIACNILGIFIGLTALRFIDFAFGPFDAGSRFDGPVLRIIHWFKAEPVRLWAAGLLFAYVMAISLGAIVGYVQAYRITLGAPECDRCNIYITEEGSVEGRPIAADNKRVALILVGKEVVLLDWAEVKAIRSGRFQEPE